MNQAVVRGLADLRCDAEEAAFVPLTFPMGLRADHDPACLDSLDGEPEVGAFLEVSRRLGERTPLGMIVPDTNLLL